jgi:hypothetical protein
MPRKNAAQLNIRSDFVRARVDEITAATGMTATQVIEDALRGYVAPGPMEPVGRLVRKGSLLVFPRGSVKGRVTHARVQAAIEADRNRDVFGGDDP